MDYIIRATACDLKIRAFAASTKDTVETARKYHNTSPVATAALGRLLTAGAMMGAMMKGDKDLLTLQVRGDGPLGGITVTADSAARVKGYVLNPGVMLPANPQGKLDVGGAVGRGTLSVIRDLGLKEPYIGQCELQTGEIGDDLAYYYSVSEQVPSAVGLGVLLEKDTDGEVRQSGGFIIQLMPDTPDEIAEALEQRLSRVKSVTAMLDEGMNPWQILEDLLGKFGIDFVEKIPVCYHCDCSSDRIKRMLISLGEKEIEDMIAKDEPVEVCCQFCGKRYLVGTDELKELLYQIRE